MYICMYYVYYIYIYIWYIYIHIYKHIHMYIYDIWSQTVQKRGAQCKKDMYRYTFIYIHIYTYIHTNTHLYIYVYVYIVHTCVYTHIYICVNIYVYIYDTHYISPKEFNSEAFYWRGIKDMSINWEDFIEHGASELAPMSTSASKVQHMTHFSVCQNSFLCVTWFVLCESRCLGISAYVHVSVQGALHDSFWNVTWLIRTWDMTSLSTVLQN